MAQLFKSAFVRLIRVVRVSIDSCLSGYESFHHRVTQGLTEFNQFEIKRIELRETLCYSVVKTHFCTVLTHSQLRYSATLSRYSATPMRHLEDAVYKSA